MSEQSKYIFSLSKQMAFEHVDCRVRDRNLSGPMSSSESLLSLVPEGQEDPTVDSQRAATHAKHLRPFLLSYFPWHSFPPIQSSYKWKQLSTEEEVQRQVERERERGGRGHMRRTSEDKKNLGSSPRHRSRKQKTYLGTDGLTAAMDRVMPAEVSKRLNHWRLCFDKDLKMDSIPGPERFLNIFFWIWNGHFLLAPSVYSFMFLNKAWEENSTEICEWISFAFITK